MLAVEYQRSRLSSECESCNHREAILQHNLSLERSTATKNSRCSSHGKISSYGNSEEETGRRKGKKKDRRVMYECYEEREKPRYGVTHWITAQNGRRNSTDEFALLIPKCLLSVTQLHCNVEGARVLRLMPLASVSKDHLAVTRGTQIRGSIISPK